MKQKALLAGYVIQSNGCRSMGRVLNPSAMRACTRHSKDPNSLRIRLREQYGLTFDRDMILDFIYAFLIFIVGLDWIIKMGM